MSIIKLLIVISFLTCFIYPQTSDTTYSLSAEVGLGYSRYFTTMSYNDLNKNGLSGTIKVMWNPEHLLSVGLETGYQQLYSYNYDNYETEFGTTNVSASMYAVPIFIIISMKVIPNVKVSAGSGAYLLNNSGESFGIENHSSQISIGAHIGASYSYPINNSFSIDGELLYSYFSKLQDQTVALQFLFVYDFLRW